MEGLTVTFIFIYILVCSDLLSNAGFMHMQATVNRGRRVSSSMAFLRPVMSRKNLHVATLAQVHRVRINV